jgi:hypothetical protein
VHIKRLTPPVLMNSVLAARETEFQVKNDWATVF